MEYAVAVDDDRALRLDVGVCLIVPCLCREPSPSIEAGAAAKEAKAQFKHDRTACVLGSIA